MNKLPALFLASLFLGLGPARAELAISANDNHLVQLDGVNTVVKNPGPDSLTVIDLAAARPTVVATIPGVPTSVIGPPFAVAITPDESLALVTCAMKVDPADPTKQAEDNRVSVVDLKASPMAVIATLTAGRAPAAVSINRAGTLALVANRGDGSVSIYTISGKTVTAAGNLPVGNALSALGHVTFTPDGTHALLTRDGDSLVTELTVEGTKVTLTGRDLRTGLRPYGIDVTRDGHAAVVGNVGYGSGDDDTISLIDMTAVPIRTVETLSVGQTPEGIKLSPDGQWCAVTVQNGTGKPKANPFHHDHGKLMLFHVSGFHLVKVAEGAIGHWSQGIVFSADNTKILVGNMVEHDIQVFSFNGMALTDTGQTILVDGGSASLRTADR